MFLQVSCSKSVQIVGNRHFRISLVDLVGQNLAPKHCSHPWMPFTPQGRRLLLWCGPGPRGPGPNAARPGFVCVHTEETLASVLLFPVWPPADFRKPDSLVFGDAVKVSFGVCLAAPTCAFSLQQRSDPSLPSGARGLNPARAWGGLETEQEIMSIQVSSVPLLILPEIAQGRDRRPSMSVTAVLHFQLSKATPFQDPRQNLQNYNRVVKKIV